MKKFIKIAAIVLIAAVFIGTFAFLYQKSQPKEVSYQILKAETKDLRQTTVATGKIDRVAVSEETVEAVERALCGEDESAGALYFVAPAYADAGNHQWFRDNLTLLFSYEGHEFYA